MLSADVLDIVNAITQLAKKSVEYQFILRNDILALVTNAASYQMYCSLIIQYATLKYNEGNLGNIVGLEVISHRLF